MKFFLILISLLNIHSLFPSITRTDKTKVMIHLEKFNEKYNLLHIGISFNCDFKTLRYDYRPFCEIDDCSYETSNINRLDRRDLFPDINLSDNIVMIEEMEKKDIYWGESEKTLDEIEEFEKTLHKKYILGVNDCRHYVNYFTRWVLDKPTPIWKLDKLWDEY